MSTTPGDRQDKDALRIYRFMEKAVLGSLKEAVKPVTDTSDALEVDVFCSLRFGEAMAQAKQVREELQSQFKLRVTIIDVPEGQDIGDAVALKIEAAKLVVIFGTETYGRGTMSCFSTKEELQFIKDQNKPFFLIKMCDNFVEPRTRMILNGSVSYALWPPGTPMPTDLPANIYKRFQRIIETTPPVPPK
eukprot:CAMPEP_0182435326 /NCGR_PEP_ID=MMETSP1167-20130531/75148_1 /TAXON_ID=2988 /ORGANISM="Mallomonas Sp, Strain CCMP3275" /LENGTH=189 /DNA_ID=CAMNT_0024626269 /DNA_START=1 /DNA_END=570 /DNA_ORIENTATION=+